MNHQENWLGRSAPDTEAIKQIRYFEGLALELDPRGYCVATSEGKDSTVLGHLYRRAGVKHFYARNITGIDPPELVYHARRQMACRREEGYIYHELGYNQSMWELIVQKGMPPMRQARYCCAELKERRHELTEGALFSFGVRKAEGARRAANRNELEIVAHGRKGKNIILPYDNEENRRTFETCYTDKEKRLNPVVYWTDSDVWDYIHEAHLPYCSLYDEGFDRLGCIGCPMAGQAGREMEFRRWPKFKAIYIRAFERMIARRRADGKRDKTGLWTSADSVFDWWISDSSQDQPLPGQLEMDVENDE